MATYGTMSKFIVENATTVAYRDQVILVRENNHGDVPLKLLLYS